MSSRCMGILLCSCFVWGFFAIIMGNNFFDFLGPVVQSIVSLMELSVKELLSLTVLTKSEVAVFLAEKLCKSSSDFFQLKIVAFLTKICLKI